MIVSLDFDRLRSAVEHAKGEVVNLGHPDEGFGWPRARLLKILQAIHRLGPDAKPIASLETERGDGRPLVLAIGYFANGRRAHFKLKSTGDRLHGQPKWGGAREGRREQLIRQGKPDPGPLRRSQLGRTAKDVATLNMAEL